MIAANKRFLKANLTQVSAFALFAATGIFFFSSRALRFQLNVNCLVPFFTVFLFSSFILFTLIWKTGSAWYPNELDQSLLV